MQLELALLDIVLLTDCYGDGPVHVPLTTNLQELSLWELAISVGVASFEDGACHLPFNQVYGSYIPLGLEFHWSHNNNNNNNNRMIVLVSDLTERV